VILAGSGSGKSTFLRQVVYGIWKQKPEDKIGMMFLEESSLETLQRLVAQISGKAAHLPENYVYYDEKTEEYIESDVPLEDSNLETVNVPDSNWAPGEKLKFAGMLAEGDRWVIWDNFSNLDPDTVLERMEYMHKVHNVTVIAFDHISMVVSGNPTQDERKTIDAFMTRMRHFVEATGVTVITINHLVKGSGQGKSAEEGGMVTLKDSKGAGSVYQLADVVITAVRNQIAEDEEERTRVDYYVLKNRPTSKAGKAGSAKYSIASDRLIEDQQPVL
jgi:twinkle protein